VAKLAEKLKAPLVISTDSHGPGDLVTREQAERILSGAGLGPDAVSGAFANAEALVNQRFG
jgi:histidinol phosphatase-like PHP family hydrolase